MSMATKFNSLFLTNALNIFKKVCYQACSIRLRVICV